MPKDFIKAVKAIKKAIRLGEIKKTYIKHGKRLRAKHLIASGVANIVGSSMIKANADIIKGL